MKVLISHPTSNQNNRAAVKGLHQAGMLAEFHTAIASFPGGLLEQLGKINALEYFSRRQFDKELKAYTKTNPFAEMGRFITSKLGIAWLGKKEDSLFSIDNIYRNQDSKVAQHIAKETQLALNAVYTYEDCALNTFKIAKQKGICCLYDLPIGYWRSSMKLLETEIEKWPEYAGTLTGFSDSKEKLQRKDEELALADCIFVASTFTANTLKEYPGKLAPIKVIPYGFPKAINKREYNMSNRPLKLLFVGGLSQRKGIANMFEAVANLGDKVQLTVIGGKLVEDCKPLNKALDKHKYIQSIPHHEVLEQMRQHDVLLFPSLFEGFGLVITEAMSQGTPVITTDRTAGPDLITHGENGWLVEAGNTQALQNCIAELVQNPSALVEAGKAALETAKKRPWEVYGKELAEAISKHKSITAC